MFAFSLRDNNSKIKQCGQEVSVLAHNESYSFFKVNLAIYFDVLGHV